MSTTEPRWYLNDQPTGTTQEWMTGLFGIALVIGLMAGLAMLIGILCACF